MRDALAAAGWRNYSLFLTDEGQVIGYVECDDFEARSCGDGRHRRERALAGRDGALLRGARGRRAPTRACGRSPRSSTLTEAETTPPPAAAPLLVVDHVTKSFGAVQALADGFIELYAGEAHALLGENGAGKSTVVKILAGVHRPDDGRLLIDGEEAIFTELGAVAGRRDRDHLPGADALPRPERAREHLRRPPAAARRAGGSTSAACARRPTRCSRSSASGSTRTGSRAASRSPTSRSSRSRRRSPRTPA